MSTSIGRWRRVGGGAIAPSTIRQILCDLMHSELAATRDKSSVEVIPRDLVVQYAVGAYMAVLTWWLDGGAKQPPERMDGCDVSASRDRWHRPCVSPRHSLHADLLVVEFTHRSARHELVLRLGYRQRGHRVAMAGDGRRWHQRSPALAGADVAIAMGAGTDIAMESAQVTLVKGDLRGVVRARRLSELTLRNIRQNLLFAFAYNGVGIPLAAGVLHPLTGWLLSADCSARHPLGLISGVQRVLRMPLRCPLPSRSNRTSPGAPKEAAEGGTFHVARRGAGSSVPQAVAHGAQLADRPVQLLRFGCEHLSVDAQPPIRREH